MTFSREITLLQGNLMATEKLEDKYTLTELLFWICVWCAYRCVQLFTCVWVYMFVWVLMPIWVHAWVWYCMPSSSAFCLIHWDRFFQWTYRQKTTVPLMTQRKDGEYNYKSKISSTFLQLEIFKTMSALIHFLRSSYMCAIYFDHRTPPTPFPTFPDTLSMTPFQPHVISS